MSITKKLINSKDLIIESWTLIKKDKSLLIPPILSILFIIVIPILIFPVLFITSSALIVTTRTPGLIFILLLIVIFSIYFVATFFNAALTWMAYEVKTGKNTTIFTGLSKAIKEFFDIILFALMTFFIGILAGIVRGRSRGSINVLGDMAAKAISTTWSILGNMIMPAMILTNHHFFSAWTEIKQYRDSIPQILVGKFGLGIIFNIILGIAFFICLFVFFTLGLVPGFISIILLIGPLIIINNVMKTLFFTLLYTQIKKIP